MMRSYSIEHYPENVRTYFHFLVTDFGFKLVEDKEREFSYLVVFEKDNIRVRLNYDYMDNYYYFSIIKGKRTIYSDEETENIITLYSIAKIKDAHINLQDLQPDVTQYLEALKFNSEILKKYGKDILEGKAWK